MTRFEEREIIRSSAIYKMSLGKGARYRGEAVENDVLVFQSEQEFYQAVRSGEQDVIARAGRKVRSVQHPKGNAPEAAWSIWKRSIETFEMMPPRTVVLHWEAERDHLYWGLTTGEPRLVREELNDFGQSGYVFHRPLTRGWRQHSINGVPLSNLHPKARELAINMATLNEVQTHADYFRALLLDEDVSEWHALPEWQTKAAQLRWKPKEVGTLRAAARARSVTLDIKETAAHFWQEIERMAVTAVQTAAYANGQTVLRVVKNKEIAFSRSELEEEIADLLREQGYACALTGYDFRRADPNPHLRMSLDRKDSSRGYVPGNMQVVTRGANFYKSASDDADWAAKLTAMIRMAAAAQRRSAAKTA